MNYRNKALLRAARGSPCWIQVPGVCRGDRATVVACHSNQRRHGKGTRIKAHDCFIAFGCAACHRWIDEEWIRDIPPGLGEGAHRQQVLGLRDSRDEIWQVGHERTMLYLFREGKLRVV